jgi:hypothetical protein
VSVGGTAPLVATPDPSVFSITLPIRYSNQILYGTLNGTATLSNGDATVEGTIAVEGGGSTPIKTIRTGNSSSIDVEGGLTVVSSGVVAADTPHNSMLTPGDGHTYRVWGDVLAGKRVVYIRSGQAMMRFSNQTPTATYALSLDNGSFTYLNPSTGSLTQDIALGEGSHMFLLGFKATDDPFLAAGTVTLTGRFIVTQNGVLSYPSAISGKLPRDIESLAGARLDFTSPVGTAEVKVDRGGVYQFELVTFTGGQGSFIATSPSLLTKSGPYTIDFKF